MHESTVINLRWTYPDFEPKVLLGFHDLMSRFVEGKNLRLEAFDFVLHGSNFGLKRHGLLFCATVNCNRERDRKYISFMFMISA